MAERFAPPQEYSTPPQYDYPRVGLGDYAVIFIIATFFFMFIFLFLLPLVLTVNTSFWWGGQNILSSGLSDIGGIGNESIKGALTGVMDGSVTMFVSAQSIIGFFAQFGWLFIIGGGILIVILLARRQVETGLV